MKNDLREELIAAVREAIGIVGISAFRRTSMFLSNQRRSYLKDAA